MKIKVKNVRNLVAKLSCDLIDLMPHRFCGALYDPDLDELNVFLPAPKQLGMTMPFGNFAHVSLSPLSKNYSTDKRCSSSISSANKFLQYAASHLSLEFARSKVQALEGRNAR